MRAGGDIVGLCGVRGSVSVASLNDGMQSLDRIRLSTRRDDSCSIKELRFAPHTYIHTYLDLHDVADDHLSVAVLAHVESLSAVQEVLAAAAVYFEVRYENLVVVAKEISESAAERNSCTE